MAWSVDPLARRLPHQERREPERDANEALALWSALAWEELEEAA